MDMKFHLTNDLKRLRMPGMIETLDLRIKEATEASFGYLEFFQLRALYRVTGRVGTRDVSFVRHGAAETFRGGRSRQHH